MKLKDATARAQVIARRRSDERYVVWSVEPDDAPGDHYHVASAFDLETYYCGSSDPVVYIGPDGRVEMGG